MKNLKTVFGAMILASFVLISCGGNSIESDAKKYADLQCKVQKMMDKAASGDLSAMEESTKLVLEAEALSKKMEGKYISEADQEEFSKALLKAMGDCK